MLKFKSPPLTSMATPVVHEAYRKQQTMKTNITDEKQDTVHVADMTVMSDNQFNTTNNEGISYGNQFSNGPRRKVPKKEKSKYHFQRLPESQTYWNIKDGL